MKSFIICRFGQDLKKKTQTIYEVSNVFIIIAIISIPWPLCRCDISHLTFSGASVLSVSMTALLSRWTHHPPTDWALHKVVVRAMFEHWPVPCVDPFASERNHKLLVFFSMCPSRTFCGINALTQNLMHVYWYVCPPKNLTPRVLRKLRLQPTAHISYWWVRSGPASCGSASWRACWWTSLGWFHSGIT